MNMKKPNKKNYFEETKNQLIADLEQHIEHLENEIKILKYSNRHKGSNDGPTFGFSSQESNWTY